MKLEPRVGACIAGGASGVLLSLAFSSPGLGWLAWLALVPLLLAVRRVNARLSFIAGFVAGLVAAFGTFSWLLVVPAFGAAQYLVLGCYVALYGAAWAAGVTLLARGPLPLILTAPALWVALDAVRSHAGFLALPWGTMAQSQHADLALLQLAAWGGESAVSFVVVMGNVAIAALIEGYVGRAKRVAPAASRGTLAAGAVIALAHGAGVLAMAQPEEGPQRVTVAAVQPAIGILERESAVGRDATWQRLESLTREAAQARPAVIVWPETAVGDPALDPLLGARLAALSRLTRSALVVGAAEAEKFATARGGTDLAVAQRDSYNSAYLVVSGARLGEPYRKRRLVPFGEYLPLRDSLPWPRWLVPEIGDGIAGDWVAGFDVPADPANGLPAALRIGVLICWESLFADLSREAVQEGAQVLVQLTNDIWFGRTRASAQHNAASLLRAIENRVPVVIASNTGPSQIIDGHGRVQARVVGLFENGVAIGTVVAGTGGTLFTRTGDLFSPGCAVLILVAFFAGRRDLYGAGFPTPHLVKESI